MSESNVVPFLGEAYWEGLGSKYDAARFQAVVEMIPKNISHILDLGCGDGKLMTLLRSRSATVGLDISRRALGKAGPPCVQGLCWECPFRDAAFDLVVCCELLEHIPDRHYVETRREIQRMARQYILVSVPFEENLEETSRSCGICGGRYQIHGHLRQFAPHDLPVLWQEFRLLQWGHVQKRTWRIAPWMRTVRESVLGLQPLSPYSVCPHCGAEPGEEGASRWFLRKATTAVGKAFLPRRHLGGWLVALYGRIKG